MPPAIADDAGGSGGSVVAVVVVAVVVVVVVVVVVDDEEERAEDGDDGGWRLRRPAVARRSRAVVDQRRSRSGCRPRRTDSRPWLAVASDQPSSGTVKMARRRTTAPTTGRPTESDHQPRRRIDGASDALNLSLSSTMLPLCAFQCRRSECLIVSSPMDCSWSRQHALRRRCRRRKERGFARNQIGSGRGNDADRGGEGGPESAGVRSSCRRRGLGDGGGGSSGGSSGERGRTIGHGCRLRFSCLLSSSLLLSTRLVAGSFFSAVVVVVVVVVVVAMTKMEMRMMPVVAISRGSCQPNGIGGCIRSCAGERAVLVASVARVLLCWWWWW